MMLQAQKSKLLHDDCDGEDEEKSDQNEISGSKSTKIKRRDVELPMAEADIKLAERLDNCLKLSETRKPRFFMNRPKATQEHEHGHQLNPNEPIGQKLDAGGKLKAKNLSKDEIRERLLRKYDTLVPELDPKRQSVKLVKVLSATESLEMAKVEAKRQLVEQLELNSVSGNQQAYINGIERFRFNDGYEMPTKGFYPKKFNVFQQSKSGTSKNLDIEETMTTQQPAQSNTTKSVKFADESRVSEEGGSSKNNINIDGQRNLYGFFAADRDDDDTLTEEDENEDDSGEEGGPDHR